MTTIESVQPVTAEEQERAVRALVLAFSADPVMRWMLPDPVRYLEAFGELALALGGKAFDEHSAYCAGDFVATALWLPPAVHSDEVRLAAWVSQYLPEQRQDTLFQLVTELDGYHPQEPHWYLPLIGVDPGHQGRGYGSTLLHRALEACDAMHQPAYLESSSERNIPLYERFGFVVTGEVQVGNMPPLWPMARQPR